TDRRREPSPSNRYAVPRPDHDPVVMRDNGQRQVSEGTLDLVRKLAPVKSSPGASIDHDHQRDALGQGCPPLRLPDEPRPANRIPGGYQHQRVEPPERAVAP